VRSVPIPLAQEVKCLLLAHRRYHVDFGCLGLVVTIALLNFFPDVLLSHVLQLLVDSLLGFNFGEKLLLLLRFLGVLDLLHLLLQLKAVLGLGLLATIELNLCDLLKVVGGPHVHHLVPGWGVSIAILEPCVSLISSLAFSLA
jgi:hypothetical protein